MNYTERIAKLLLGHLKEELNDNEKVELKSWVDSSNENRKMFEQLNDREYFLDLLQTFEKQKIVRQMIDEYGEIKTPVVPFYKHFLFKAAVAVALIIIGVSSWFFLTRNSKNTIVSSQQKKQIQTDFLPGRNKAILILSDGSSINLDSAANGSLAEQGNSKVAKSDNKLITYNTSNDNAPANTVHLQYNTISTPRGGQYEVLLSDGTKVLLNAASSLRFPTSFSGRVRTVELTGEGYFEVAKNASTPFIVKVNDMAVTVLGTHFNINSYNDESSIKTTLLEGSVKINSSDNKKSIRLTPGQQALYANGDVSLAENPDVESSLAWKDGMFRFNRTDIETIMRQISRWYDVEIVYGSKVPHLFSGKISRDVPVSELFKLLELTNRVHFTIEGHNIIVKP